MPQVYVSAGSNHNRQQNIAMALGRLKARFGRLQVSPVYESPAVNGKGAAYYNLAVGFETDESAAALRASLREIEEALGRDRSRPEQVSIDLDLLLYGDSVETVAGCELPHPDLRRHRHVLQPLADIAADLVLPGTDRSLISLLAEPDMASQVLQAVVTGEHEL